MSLLQFVRIILVYIVNRARQAGGGMICSWLCCCGQCCLACIQKIVEFINKQAYVIVGVKVGGWVGWLAAATQAGHQPPCQMLQAWQQTSTILIAQLYFVLHLLPSSR